MPRARLVFDGDWVYTEKEARIHKLTQETETKIDNIPGVVDDVNSTSTTDALSANMGKRLQDQINQLTWLNKFLSTWDCTTGLPVTDPSATPFTYTSGNYYLVATVAWEWGTNYKPHWSTFTPWVASTAVETNEVNVNDMYIFDWSQWILQVNKVKEIIVDDGLSPDSTNAVENRAIYSALTTKQDKILDLNDIRTGAALWATSLQPWDNITELTNNVGYQTAGDVASAINDAIEWSKYVWPTAPDPAAEWMLWYDTTNDVLKVYNWTSWNNVDTTYSNWTYLTLNGTTFDVDTNTIATKTYVDTQVAESISSWSTAPQNPTEWQLWYDTTNNVLKVWNWTSWDVIDINLKWDLNTKTFTLSWAWSSDTVLAEAQAIYDWYRAGKEAIIVYSPERSTVNNDKSWIYVAIWQFSNDTIRFISCDLLDDYTGIHWGRSIQRAEIYLQFNNSNEVISVQKNTVMNIASYLSTTSSNFVYTPSDNYDPATKKYVDDKVKNAITSWTTAPSNPVVWQLWYDTTNEVLKVWNWTAWIAIQELLVNWVNIKTVNNHNLLWSWNIDIIWVEEIQFVTQAEYDALPSSKLSDSKAYFIYSWHGAAIVSDEPFWSTWDWITTQAPSKNAIYDVLGDVETLLANL